MTAALERFIRKVPAHIAPPTEPTLFSLGGRGHYENATSDLLAFFLRADGERGLGPAFHSFLECLPGTPNAAFICTKGHCASETRADSTHRSPAK